MRACALCAKLKLGGDVGHFPLGLLSWARSHERGKKTRQTEKEVGGQHQGMNMPGVRRVPESSGEQRKMEETGCEVFCGAPTTPAVMG